MCTRILTWMLVAVVACTGGAAIAGWDDCDPLVPSSTLMREVIATDDGQGGSLVLHHYDGQGSVYDEIRISRIDAAGEVLFTLTQYGSNIRSAHTSVAADDTFGYFIFRDDGSTYVRAIDIIEGAFRTGAERVAQEATEHNGYLKAVADNNRGAWFGYLVRTGTNNCLNLWTTHMDTLGLLNTLSIGNTDNPEYQGAIKFDMAANEDGDCYFAWEVAPSPSSQNWDVLVQYADRGGSLAFGPDGAFPVDSNGTDQMLPALACTGPGLAVLALRHEAETSGLFAQMISGVSYRMWGDNGVPVYATTSGTGASQPVVASDGLSGAVVAFKNTNDALGRDGIIAQRLNGFGEAQWTEGAGRIGTHVTTTATAPVVLTHGGGGVLIAWNDFDNGTIYCQGLDAYAYRLWPDGDHVVCDGTTSFTPSLHSDGNNGGYVVAKLNGDAVGGKAPWALLDATGREDYEIVAGSNSTTLRPTDAGIFEIGFYWRTYGITSAVHDHVTLSGSLINPANCWLTPGQSVDLDGSDYNVTSRIYPSPLGGTLHELLWSRKTCEAPCLYDGPAYSGDGVMEDDIRVKLDVPFCPGGLKTAAPSFGDAVPNPFNPATTLSFFVPRGAARVSLEIYNLRGQRVRSFEAGSITAGWNELTWQGNDNQGARVSSGVYFARLTVDGQSAVQKLALLK